MSHQQPQSKTINLKQFSSLSPEVPSLLWQVKKLQHFNNYTGPVGFCVPVSDIEFTKLDQNIPWLKQFLLVVLPDEMHRHEATELAESELQIFYAPFADGSEKHPMVYLQGENNYLVFSLWDLESTMVLPKDNDGIPLLDESANILTIFLHRDTVMATSKSVDAKWSSTSAGNSPWPLFAAEPFAGVCSNSLKPAAYSSSIIWEMPIRKLNGFVV